MSCVLKLAIVRRSNYAVAFVNPIWLTPANGIFEIVVFPLPFDLVND